MTDPRLDAAARDRDLPAVVEAVGERRAVPPGPLAACARALVRARLADEETAPAIARVAVEAVLREAKACKRCGDAHKPRYAAPRQGDLPLLTWAALDGHPYEEAARPAAFWLDKILQEGM